MAIQTEKRNPTAIRLLGLLAVPFLLSLHAWSSAFQGGRATWVAP